METDIQVTVRLHSIACWHCGMIFAMPSKTKDALLENGETFYCPLGHGQVFSKKKNLEKQLEEAQRLLTAEKCAKQNLAADLQREREVHAKDAALTKRRHASGKCPCCQRSFASLARHIKHMHPDYCPSLK